MARFINHPCDVSNHIAYDRAWQSFYCNVAHLSSATEESITSPTYFINCNIFHGKQAPSMDL